MTAITKVSSKKLLVIITLCATLALLVGIGSWVYVQRQNMAQKDRELQQTKQLKEYEQQQINERASKARQCENARANEYTSYPEALACR